MSLYFSLSEKSVPRYCWVRTALVQSQSICHGCLRDMGDSSSIRRSLRIERWLKARIYTQNYNVKEEHGRDAG